jgi:hypothetical protein
MFAFRVQSRRLRPFIWAVLFAWLFALTTGVVNACALDLLSEPARGLAIKSQTAHTKHTGAHTEHHQADGPVSQHEYERNSSNDGCLKFCDAESSALSKDNTTAQQQVVLLVAATQWPVAVVPTSSVGAGLPARPSAQGPPLVIRFLRLTL